MKFKLSTKPLNDALDIGVINQNVSAFYQKSCLAQVTATASELRINLEASSIYTELVLKGSGDIGDYPTVFVDCLVLKKLISTFDAPLTTIEFTESGLVIQSGKSTFNLPKMLDGTEIIFNRPHVVSEAKAIPVDKSNWKFIRDFQMYAIAMAFIHPVYTKVWVSGDGDVLVGDFDNGVFTHSKQPTLNQTCLLSPTIIHLFNSLPDGAILSAEGNSYIVNVNTDGFKYTTEFTPDYEDGVNLAYNSGIILDMMSKDANSAIKLDVSTLQKALSQSAIFGTGSDDTVKLSVQDSVVTITDNHINCTCPLETPATFNYEIEFKTVLFKSVISNLDEDTICINPILQDDEPTGVVIWTKKLTSAIGGVE